MLYIEPDYRLTNIVVLFVSLSYLFLKTLSTTYPSVVFVAVFVLLNL